MYKTYKIIDADAHITEPNDLWSDFMEAEFYDRRPIVGDPDDDRRGARRTFGPCELFPEGTKPKGTLMGGGHQRKAKRTLLDFMPEKYGKAWDAIFSPESRVEDMDRLGWDKMVCIDNFPGPLRGIQEGADQALLNACARAYNNYSRSFCDTDPSKLKMVGVVPDQHDFENLVKEARRAVAELDAVTVIVPRPQLGTKWHDPRYEPFWALAEELDFPMSFHGVQSAPPRVGQRYQPRHMVTGPEVALEHAMSFSFENMVSFGHVCFMGLLEKFPKMRCGFLEGNAGWLPFWLSRLDDHSKPGSRQGMWFDEDPLPLLPSEYFKRQCYVACDPDEGSLKGAVLLVGEDNIVWNTDYSHPDAPDPDKAAPDLLAQDIPDSAKHKILWDNSVGLYGKRILS
ncbi:MAG: amidohydrolase [SAR202 cluster bacterium]|nr:amidohydrolase [SAR202 cluster bacterium]